ncbi:unnamed protein product [Clavelina lepadiformis]|uniref:Uncharacterized protein n=1 Tax=Clavelina lepadiformis TaxID=159417 RepID=A0ABP0F827_CLALP
MEVVENDIQECEAHSSNRPRRKLVLLTMPAHLKHNQDGAHKTMLKNENQGASATKQIRKRKKPYNLLLSAARNERLILIVFVIIVLLPFSVIAALNTSNSVFIWITFTSGAIFVIFAFLTIGCANCGKCLQTVKKKRCDSVNLKKLYQHKLEDFPYDPVLQRGVINLVYHGPNDCQECKISRRLEDEVTFSGSMVQPS